MKQNHSTEALDIIKLYHSAEADAWAYFNVQFVAIILCSGKTEMCNVECAAAACIVNWVIARFCAVVNSA